MSTMTVLSGPERRRRWTLVEKERIVAESLRREASVTEVARRHDIHPNLLHLWRRQARTGALGGSRGVGKASDGGIDFAAVTVAAEERALAVSPGAGVIEIEFAGGARLRISGAVDAASVSAAIAAVARGVCR
jgi:transposase